MALNTTGIANLLRPGLDAITGEYDMYPNQWSKIYKTYESKLAQEQDVQMKYLGLAQIMQEGAPVPYDTMAQRTITSFVHRWVGLGFAITRQAIDDNLYKTQFPRITRALMESMAQTKEILAASILNNGFNGNFPIGDGQALYSLNHPIDNGVVANTPAANVDLSEAALESAVIGIQSFLSQSGLTVMIQPEQLVVPKQGGFVAERLMASQFRVNTANNDISAIVSLGTFPKGAVVNQYLTIPNSWYITTNCPNGFKHFVRTKLETDVYTDMSTKNLLATAMERYSFGVADFRCSWASRGT